MAERPNELKKLADIAGDTGISAELRTKSVELIGKIGTHDALLVLLELAADKELATEEREYARDIIKVGR